MELKNKTAREKGAMRGIFLTLDVVFATLLLFMVILLAYSYYGTPTDESFNSQLLRSYLQDASTVMIKKGYLSDPFVSVNATNSSGIREILRATPDSVCMQVSGYASVISEDAVGYWKLDDSGTSAADSSPNGLSGALSGSPSSRFTEGGQAGRAAYFDGSSGAVVIPYDARLQPSSLTVSAWVNLENDGTAHAIVSSMPGYLLAVSSGGVPSFSIADTGGGIVSAASSARIPFGQWVFLAGTYDPASRNVTIFVDGRRTGESVATGAIAYGASPLSISDTSSSDGTVKGYVDEVGIFSRSLPDSEIARLYSNPSNLAYVVGKQECSYGGGEIQVLTIPFAYNRNQNSNSYHYAVLKAWYRGAR